MPHSNILNDLLGAALIAAVLTALALIVKFIYTLYQKRRLKRANAEAQADDTPASAQAAHISQGELKLIDVDEKTAALIMAVVSHESGIPLNELDFHSIRLIGETAGE